MKEKHVLELANILGYKIEKKTIYGVSNGYHFSLNPLPNKNIPVSYTHLTLPTIA